MRWLLAARRNGRWNNTQENATALESLVGYYKVFEAEIPNMTASVAIGSNTVGSATFRGRSSTAQSVRLAMPDLVRQVAAGTEKELTMTRAGTGHLYYSSRLQFVLTEPLPALDQGMRVERRYERFAESGTSPAATSFAAGDLIRVTLTLTLPKERRYVAVNDPLPAGVEAVDSWFRTTASDLAKDASASSDDRPGRRATAVAASITSRSSTTASRSSRRGCPKAATSSRTSCARRPPAPSTSPGTRAEEMYAPEVSGRTGAVVIQIR